MSFTAHQVQHFTHCNFATVLYFQPGHCIPFISIHLTFSFDENDEGPLGFTVPDQTVIIEILQRPLYSIEIQYLTDEAEVGILCHNNTILRSPSCRPIAYYHPICVYCLSYIHIILYSFYSARFFSSIFLCA